MSETPNAATGTIYDIGYQHYEGQRLGRAYAIRSLFIHGLLTVFAVGRGFKAAILPIMLGTVAILPAIVQAAIVAYLDVIPEFITYANYFMRLSVVFALFCAARAPALVCADRRSNTLVLYFARAIHREDYALAKVMALAVAVFVLAVVPLMILFVGRVFASTEPWSAFWEEAPQIVPIVLSSGVGAVLLASLSIVIASFTHRRALAAATVLGFFLLSSTVSEILMQIVDADWGDWLSLLNPFIALGGYGEHMFEVRSGFQPEIISRLDLPNGAFTLACFVYIVGALGLLLWRYRRIET